MKTFQSYALCFLLSVFFFSCTEEEQRVDPVLKFGSVTDIQGNRYRTVLIGGKWWMAENLRTGLYRDSTAVNILQSDVSWNDSLAGYCIHPSASEAMGYLYNGYAVENAKGLAPAGWHIATDQEWKELEQELGMDANVSAKNGWRGSNQGDKLKAVGLDNWDRFDPVWATDERGFSALASGNRIYTGEYGQPGVRRTAFWWTATAYASGGASELYYRHLDYKFSGVFRQHEIRRYGMSVRCVKD